MVIVHLNNQYWCLAQVSEALSNFRNHHTILFLISELTLKSMIPELILKSTLPFTFLSKSLGNQGFHVFPQLSFWKSSKVSIFFWLHSKIERRYRYAVFSSAKSKLNAMQSQEQKFSKVHQKYFWWFCFVFFLHFFLSSCYDYISDWHWAIFHWIPYSNGFAQSGVMVSGKWKSHTEKYFFSSTTIFFGEI